MLKAICSLWLLTFAAVAFAHPGGGIIALSENSVIVSDPTERFIWLVEKGKEPKPLISKFHVHWMTRGLDGKVYAEAFQESGGAWSSAAFQLDLQSATLTEVAHRRNVGALVFAVDRDGSLVFQRSQSLVSWRNSRESAFRKPSDPLIVANVTAYAWGPDGDLFFADRNQIRLIDHKGVASLIAEIEGKVLEPKIWNATDTPSIFSVAIDDSGRVLAAMPDLGKVYRVEKNRTLQEIARTEDGWRATGVSPFGHSIFLSETDSRASTGPRVRILRPNGTIELLIIPPPSK
jgi:hypothetical protein